VERIRAIQVSGDVSIQTINIIGVSHTSRFPERASGVVVRNARTGGQWGSEERQLSASPFAEGQYFDVSIRCGSQRFEVFVNEQHLFDFFHRTNFSEIDKLEIDGDVQISYVQL
uniref:Galectin n=1 Tax=Poecilia reticulata TaxID=8081 RepID=A0A3P9PY15_POERE